MNHVSIRQRIAAPPQRVWEVLSALPDWPRWCPTISRLDVLDAAAPGLGSKAYVEQPGLRPAVWTVTRWDPEQGFTWESRHPGIRVTGDHRIAPVTDGCEVQLSLSFAGLLAAMLGPWLRTVARKAMTREAHALMCACERRPAEPGPGTTR